MKPDVAFTAVQPAPYPFLWSELFWVRTTMSNRGAKGAKMYWRVRSGD